MGAAGIDNFPEDRPDRTRIPRNRAHPPRIPHRARIGPSGANHPPEPNAFPASQPIQASTAQDSAYRM